MKINKVTAAYFSPTGGTKTYVCQLAKLLSADYEEINLTKPDNREKVYSFAKDELVIFGAPVYSGRLPGVRNGIFERMQGDNTPAVFVVSYGNREYDDALLEEKDICEQNGFRGIAAATLVAQHTFSSKIATGRPNKEDIATLDNFANQIRATLEKSDVTDKKLEVKGNRPYREPQKIPFVPRGGKKCNECGKCIKICPVGGISKSNPRLSDKSQCLSCSACIMVCPEGARKISSLLFKPVIYGLVKKLTKTEKENEFFYLS